MLIQRAAADLPLWNSDTVAERVQHADAGLGYGRLGHAGDAAEEQRNFLRIFLRRRVHVTPAVRGRQPRQKFHKPGQAGRDDSKPEQTETLCEPQETVQCTQQRGAAHAGCKQAHSGRFSAVPLPDEFQACGIYELAVGHVRGAHRFAGTTGEAMIQMRHKARSDCQRANGETLHQRNASARRFTFVAGLQVGGTVRQA